MQWFWKTRVTWLAMTALFGCAAPPADADLDAETAASELNTVSTCEKGVDGAAFSVRCHPSVRAGSTEAFTPFSFASVKPGGFCAVELRCLDGSTITCVGPVLGSCSATARTPSASVSCEGKKVTCAPDPTFTPKPGPTLPQASSWRLTFDDEFSAPTIDGTKWTSMYNGFNANNVFVRNGKAVLRIDETAPAPSPFGNRVVALNTQGRFSQKFGWYEIRAKMAAGGGVQGAHSAFWLLAENDDYLRSIDQGGRRLMSESFEIDVFETDTGTLRRDDFTLHAGNNPDFIFGASKEHRRAYAKEDLPFVQSDDFHTYAVLWTPETVTSFVDGRRLQTIGSAPRDSFNVFVNLYEHGDHDPAIRYPLEFEVDYVRVYGLP